MASRRPLVIIAGRPQQLPIDDVVDGLPARKVGFVQVYTGVDNASAGWLDDYDGKWVYLTLDSIRTIGSASSGAHIAQDWVQELFLHLWLRYSAAQTPMLDSSGAAVSKGTTAAADWAANKRLTMPDFRGRAFVGAGTGFTLSARTRGFFTGTEQEILSLSQMPAHSHDLQVQAGVASSGTAIGVPNNIANSAAGRVSSSVGGGQAHNNMQPSSFEHYLISAGAR